VIEESAQVVAVSGGRAWVQTRSRSACGHCASSAGCGTSVLGGLLSPRSVSFPVDNTVDAAVGDEVVLGVAEEMLVKASLTVYLLPLLSMLLAAMAAVALGLDDGAGGVCGLLGLGAGLYGVHRLSRCKSGRGGYLPVVLRRSPKPPNWNYPIHGNASLAENRHD